MRRLDIGLVAYGNYHGVDAALESMFRTMRTDFRVIVIVNPHPKPDLNDRVREVLSKHFSGNLAGKLSISEMPENLGYAGGVNEFLKLATTEYIAYADHDAAFQTRGWDERMASMLDRHHEVGIVFPNGGHAPIPREDYTEILWGVGCAWMLTRLAYSDVGPFDTTIGHHEEVDYITRIRLAGYKVVSIPDLMVSHEGTATSNPANMERINRGIRNWVNKWCAYFCGKNVNYHSDFVLRHEDWHPSALHMEQYFLHHLGQINANPEVITLNGVEYDLIKVPRYKGFYRHRII